MKSNVLIFSAIFFLAGYYKSIAQTYQVEVLQRPYKDLVDGQNLVTQTWDDIEFDVPLGFSLVLFNDTIEELHSADFFAGGYVASSLDFSNTNLILAFSTDPIDRGYEIDTLLSQITYKTEGEPGNKTFTLEYENIGFPNGEVVEGIYTDFINYQLIIYEASGDIEMHIGPYSVTNPGLDFEGHAGPSIGIVEGFDFINGGTNGEICMISGDPISPTINTTIDFNLEPLIWPIPENTVYRFYKPTSKVNELNKVETVNCFKPSPTSGNISLQSQWVDQIVGPVSVINSTGQTVTVDRETNIIEMEGLPDGVYQLYFTTVKGTAVQRILLIRE